MSLILHKERLVSAIYRSSADNLLQRGCGGVIQAYISDVGVEFIGLHGYNLKIGWILDVRSDRVKAATWLSVELK